MNTKRLTKQADRLTARYEQARSTVRTERREVKQARRRTAAATQAREIVQGVAQRVQQHAHAHIACVVTKALRGVFGKEYGFKIHFDRKRGKTEARFVFTRRGEEVDPCSASGAGIIEIAAFALRIACITLHSPGLRPLVVLDEPFARVRNDRLPRVRILLETLAADLGIQFVIVTHNELLTTGKVIQIGDK